jgi:DNA primase
MMEVVEYGKEKIAAGPSIEESEEIIIVEGRADVINLLKHGFKNAIAMNGTSCPQSIKELTKRKTTTVFVDGDRGGNLIIRELLSVADIDFVCKAPDGKEVEEITKKEIHKALRGKITAEQAKLDLGVDDDGALKVAPKSSPNKQSFRPKHQPPQRPVRDNRQNNRTETRTFQKPAPKPIIKKKKELSPKEKEVFKSKMEDLFGTRGACIFDNNLKVLGKVPISELSTTIKSLNGGIYALALDGDVSFDLVKTAEKLGVSYVIGKSTKAKGTPKINVFTEDKL